MELCGSKVQLATPHGNFINGVINSEIVYSFTCTYWEFYLCYRNSEEVREFVSLKIFPCPILSPTWKRTFRIHLTRHLRLLSSIHSCRLVIIVSWGLPCNENREFCSTSLVKTADNIRHTIRRFIGILRSLLRALKRLRENINPF